MWSVTSTLPTPSFVFRCLARFGEAAYLLGRMKQKLKKSVWVCETHPVKYPAFPPFISGLSNDFLSTLLLGWVRKPPLWQELQEWEFFNHIFSPQSRRNHTEWKNSKNTFSNRRHTNLYFGIWGRMLQSTVFTFQSIVLTTGPGC